MLLRLRCSRQPCSSQQARCNLVPWGSAAAAHLLSHVCQSSECCHPSSSACRPATTMCQLCQRCLSMALLWLLASDSIGCTMFGTQHFQDVGTRGISQISEKISLRMIRSRSCQEIRAILVMIAQVGRLHQRQHSGHVSAGVRTGDQQTRVKTRRPQARPLGRTGGQTASLPRTTALVSGVPLSRLYMIKEQSQHLVASTLLTGTTEASHISSLGPVFI